MPHAARLRLLIVAGGLVLFLSVGMRQGFGLFLSPVVNEGGLSRQQFSFAVALQYLIWGMSGPIAARLTRWLSCEGVLGLGGVLYAAGFVTAAMGHTADAFIFGAGILIGLGLGLASYGIVNGIVSMAVEPERRGRALGAVSSIAALGQLVLLGFTHWALTGGSWCAAFEMHAALVACIVPLAALLYTIRSSPVADRLRQVTSRSKAFALQDLLWVCVGFGFSGFQAMFTMTHLPAILTGAGSTAAVAASMLGVLSLTSFVGSYMFGRIADRFDKRRLLALIYLARGVCAAAFPFMPPHPLMLGIYFFLLGFVWLCTIPVVSALTADLFGADQLALRFGYVFLAHQIGGFCGTWLGGVVAERTGSYVWMFPIIVVLCLTGAASTFLISNTGALGTRELKVHR